MKEAIKLHAVKTLKVISPLGQTGNQESIYLPGDTKFGNDTRTNSCFEAAPEPSPLWLNSNLLGRTWHEE